MTILILLAASMALLYLLFFCHRGPSGVKTAVKTLSVAALALAALSGGGPLWLIVALALCALGDLLLSRPGERAFLTGVGAFALGHLAYVALFLSTPGAGMFRLSFGPYPFGIAILCLYGVAMMAALYRRAGDLRFAVMGYVPIILGMGVAAMTVPALGPLAWVLPAALLFMLSDSVLASELFLLPEGHPARRFTPFLVWGAYWLAQLGFTLAYMPV